MRRAIVASVAALVAATGSCSRSTGRGNDDAAAAPAAQPVATSAMPAPVAAPALVGHQRLEAFVPTGTGWTLAHSTGADLQLPAPASHVRAAFTRDKMQIDLELTDTGGDPSFVEALSKVAGGDFHQEAPSGYMKAVTIAGFPAIESFNHDDQIGEIIVLVNHRFTVHASGSGTGGIEPVRDFVSRVDLAGLAALK